jgi:hypothetical protein
MSDQPVLCPETNYSLIVLSREAGVHIMVGFRGKSEGKSRGMRGYRKGLCFCLSFGGRGVSFMCGLHKVLVIERR